MSLIDFLQGDLSTTQEIWASLGPAVAVPLRLWGRRIQVLSAVVIVLVGGALIYSGINPGFFDRLILPT